MVPDNFWGHHFRLIPVQTQVGSPKTLEPLPTASRRESQCRYCASWRHYVVLIQSTELLSYLPQAEYGTRVRVSEKVVGKLNNIVRNRVHHRGSRQPYIDPYVGITVSKLIPEQEGHAERKCKPLSNSLSSILAINYCIRWAIIASI